MSGATEREGHTTIIWTIENAPALEIPPYSVTSPTIISEAIERTHWNLTLVINSADSHNFLCVRRNEEINEQEESIEIDFDVALLGADDAPLANRTHTETFSRGFFSLICVFDKDEVFNHKRAQFLPKDILKVRCRMWMKGMKTSKRDLCIARTRMARNSFFFVWAITGFSSLRLGQQRTRSLKSNSRGSPILVLNFGFNKAEGKENVCISIDRVAAGVHYWMFGEIALLDAECAVVHSEKIIKYIPHAGLQVWSSKTFFGKEELLSDNSKFLIDDVLYLRCKFDFEPQPLWNKIESCKHFDTPELQEMTSDVSDVSIDETNGSVAELCPFSEILNRFYCDSTLTDVVLRTSSESFSVHKVVLCCRSAVFGAIFAGDFQGETRMSFDIPDLDADTLRRLLSYLYTNKVPEMDWKGATDLYRAANKFELLELEHICSEFLKSNISISNVCILLSLADIHHHKDLLKALLDFILNNSNVLKSEAWKIFKRENSKRALDITERVISSLTNSNR